MISIPDHNLPYSFDTETLPEPREREYHEGMFYGVHLTMHPDNLPFILEKIESWFAIRDEIILIDNDVTSKMGLAFIILEWQGCEIDPLFLAILENEDIIADFSVYERPEEV